VIRVAACLVLIGITGCAAVRTSLDAPLGTARAASDFHDYAVQRAGVVAPRGGELDPESALSLRDALASSFAAQTPWELVPIGEPELESVGWIDPVRTGRTRPEPLLDLARRAGLDALFVPHVVDYRPYEPARIGVEVDLVAVETGLTIWSGRVRIDTADQRTLDAIEAWQIVTRGGGASERAVDLLSPRRLGEFAAAELARLL
jgi:uncharacterized protein YceK